MTRERRQSQPRNPVPTRIPSALAEQRKPSVVFSHDRLEQQADEAADRVMRMPGPAAGDSAPTGATLEGAPLSENLRSWFEPRFAHDFSRVRVHTDGEGASEASAMRARAFTRGRDIVFGPGEYRPTTARGRQLLAHELAHVVQQSEGCAPDEMVQRKGVDSSAGKTNPDPTENVKGTLWATDASGKTLPPSLDDLSQGAVADCFLFAALAAIVNTHPQQIVNMIHDNGDGTYTVTFKGIGFFSSAKQKVTADFPVGKHGNVTGRAALWPLIMEKAYAQQKGGIDVIGKGGNAGDVLDDLLDDSPSRFDPREKPADYIMGKLAKAKEKKWPMTILAPKKEGAGKDKKGMAENTPGLHFWHSYAIVDIDAVKNRIKLFNPWGHDHPNGDGWMDVEQVRKFFIEIDINH